LLDGHRAFSSAVGEANRWAELEPPFYIPLPGICKPPPLRLQRTARWRIICVDARRAALRLLDGKHRTCLSSIIRLSIQLPAAFVWRWRNMASTWS
jgi:hypothetical protein